MTTKSQAQPPERIWIDASGKDSSFWNDSGDAIGTIEYVRADLPRAAADVPSIINDYIDECGQAMGTATDVAKLRLHHFQAAANEILRRIIATPRAETRLTVEAALKELREMFPDFAVHLGFQPQPEGHNFISVCIRKGSDGTSDLQHFCYKSGLTLQDCMNQVRAWAKSRAEKGDSNER